MHVGIDVDGVLADNVPGLIPRIRQRHGVIITRAEISQWDYPVGNTHVGHEVESALNDSEYLLSMPTLDGAKEFLDSLFYAGHVVSLLTARDNRHEQTTRLWLAAHDLKYDNLEFGKIEQKSLHGTDILIDDYHGNVVEFIQNTDGRAILLLQPWNVKHLPELQLYIEKSRLFIAKKLYDVLQVIEDIDQITL